MKITNQIVEKHGLKLEEFAAIKKLLKRDPNFLELGIFSAMWNEHCSYKSSRKHLKNLPTKGKRVIQKMVKGEKCDIESSGLSKREWNELMTAFGFTEKLV